jgi:predicted glycogen debranching enzyme
MLVSGEGLTLPRGLEREWLLTNGLGGYAMGTVAGAHARAYHGWLVAAERPPGGRRLRLVKVEPSVRTAEGEWIDCSTNLYPAAVHPDGHRRLLSFADTPQPTWRYRLPSGILEVSLRLVAGANAAVAAFRLDGEGAPLALWLRPLVNDRDHHARTRAGSIAWRSERGEGGGVRLTGGAGGPLSLWVPDGTFVPDDAPVWVRDMRYPEEERRGYAHEEDHFSPGRFRVDLVPGKPVWFAAWVGEAPADLLTSPVERPAAWPSQFGVVDPPAALGRLVRAQDAFDVVPAGGGRAIVAGYPWFGEWARDAAVATLGVHQVRGDLEGSALVLARLSAGGTGTVWPSGPDEPGTPRGLTADAPLLWAVAVYRLWAYGGDVSALLGPLDRLLRQLTAPAADVGPGGAGCRLGRRALVRAEAPGAALTWMDAAVPEPVTPRAGYPVELTALAYKALRGAERMGVGGGRYGRIARVMRRAFRRAFLRSDSLLWDCLDPDGVPRDPAVRPNQLWAAAPPFPLLTPEETSDLLLAVEPLLWTARGLRTLSPEDVRYRGRYAGTQVERDRAYHQGSAWPFLLGVWADAHHWAYPTGSGPAALRDQLDAVWPALEEGALGHVAELYDGDVPQQARGAPAQAWSASELLRAYVEDALGVRPPVLDDPEREPGLAGAGS